MRSESAVPLPHATSVTSEQDASRCACGIAASVATCICDDYSGSPVMLTAPEERRIVLGAQKQIIAVSRKPVSLDGELACNW